VGINRVTGLKSASVLVASFAVAFAVLAAYQARAGDGKDRPPPLPEQPAQEAQLTERQIPSLTSTNSERATNIARTSPALTSAGADLVVDRIGVWHEYSGVALGAVLEVTLQKPLTGVYEFPSMIYDEGETTSPPYTMTSYRVELTGISRLQMLVDLTKGEVVDVRPIGEYPSVKEPSPSGR
jgi:hypothetical protein